MLEIEDLSLENELFEGRAETLVPIEITRSKGETRIVTFSRILDVARELEKKFSSDPFSDNAISFVEEKMAEIIKKWGYFTDDYFPKHILTYLAEDIDESLILPTTKMIKSTDGYENLTEYELEPIDNSSDEVYFVTETDGKIVSVCEMNAEDAFLGATEINVFTAEDYRKKGYAQSNATAMVKYLASLGRKVAYTAPIDNKSSVHVAEQCGFKLIAETYYYICYLEENNEEK